MLTGAQCSGRLATNRRSLACSDVRARRYGGGACPRRDVMRYGSSGQNQFDLPLFHSNFLQISK
jgi:hypothetical protein